MTKWIGALLSFGCLVGGTTAQAQSYPSKTITIVVTAAAGGVSDVVARAIGQRLSEVWGQQVVIDNKGVGAPPHMNLIKFENMAQVKLQAVHYRGAAPALNDIMAGHIDLMSVSLSLVVQPAAEKKLKVLAVGSAKHVPQLPDAPTVSES